MRCAVQTEVHVNPAAHATALGSTRHEPCFTVLIRLSNLITAALALCCERGRVSEPRLPVRLTRCSAFCLFQQCGLCWVPQGTEPQLGGMRLLKVGACRYAGGIGSVCCWQPQQVLSHPLEPSPPLHCSLFRTMGLRHMFVSPPHPLVSGLITRKDIITGKLHFIRRSCYLLVARRGSCPAPAGVGADHSQGHQHGCVPGTCLGSLCSCKLTRQTGSTPIPLDPRQTPLTERSACNANLCLVDRRLLSPH